MSITTSPRARRLSSPERGWRRLLAPLLVLTVAFGLLQAAPAQAAGSAVVSVTPTIVHPTTGALLPVINPTDASLGGRYRVDFAVTCGVAACDNTTVTIAPNPKDPYYNYYILENGGYTFTPPFAGATATGTPATGITVNLGNLAAGYSGVFQIYYAFNFRPGAPGLSGASFFATGTPIPAAATIQSSTAVGPASGTTSALWQTNTRALTANVAPTTTTTRTDTSLTVWTTGYTGCDYFNVYHYGLEQYQCARKTSMVTTLPANAQYVAGSATGGGVYNAAARTITWAADDTGASVPTSNAARGPLSQNFKVTFPSSAYPTTGAGCVATETFSTKFDAVLLDGTPQTTTVTGTEQVQNCDPFSGIYGPSKLVIGPSAGTSTAPIVYIPAAGQSAITGNWTVTVGNTANVAGVATITDTDLDQPDLPVFQVNNVAPAGGPTMTVSYTLKDASNNVTAGTATLAPGQYFTAPAGKRIVSVTATSASIPGPNVSPVNQTAHNDAGLRFFYTVSPGVTPGTRTNTATATMSYPGYSLATLNGTASRTVTLQNAPATLPNLNITTGPPTASPSGSNIVPGIPVTWPIAGSVTSAPNNSTIVPQYVFIAPAGWNITGSSWLTAPPAGTTVVQRQVTIAGVVRNIIVATWPSAITIGASGSSGALPTLNVVATPTTAAPAGPNTANALMGDVNRGSSTFSPGTYTETADLAADGTTGDKYAGTTFSATVTGTPALTVTKEICRPDGSGGCIWIADPNVIVGVEPAATSIQYRITITNTGSAQANNVVAYDVLPYIGDSGLTDASASTPRGSTVKETLSSVSGVPGDVVLAYSTSTNPPRPSVSTGATTGDWTAPASGASALRATITALGPGVSRTFTYEAALVGGSADQIACNSVAAVATSLSAVEPSPVCATTQQADLSVVAGSRFPLQVGRVGTVPFVVNNGGGSQLATGTVTIDVPTGLTISTLTIPDWDCTAPSLTGPVTVTCDPVDGTGASRQLQKNVAETIPLQVIPSATGTVCFDADIAGIMNDPVLGNNDATVCSTVVAATPLLTIDKTDGVTDATIGDTLTYTITAHNAIVDQGLLGVVVTDVLPAGVEWVSGGTVSGQDADGLGGTVTFPATDLAAAGTSTGTGTGTTNPASTATFTVVVRVAPTATGDIVNAATVKATDPVGATPLTATGTDTDALRRLTVTKSSNAPAAGVRTGDSVTYTVILTNDGTSAYTAGVPARVLDDLSGVLDDASYASGTVSVDGGAPSPIAPNVAQDLVWSGALGAGKSVVISYIVTIGAGADEVLTNSAFASGQPGGTCTNGSDADGISCATVQSIFAPLIGKRIQSFAQNDDGTWTIVYAIDVTNPSPIGTSTYDLTDTLKFGTGIQVLSASAAVPAGVTAASPAWSGSGAIANGVSIAGGAQQTYTVTVTADAHQVAGTAQAVCVPGATGGFANQATIKLTGISDASAQACATPVAPTITKTAGAATQQADGSWNVVYTVTVRNTNAAPADLAYTVEDALDFPTGTSINTVQVAGPGANASFDGTGDTALLSGVGRIPAPTGGSTSTTRVYTVTVNVDAPVGAVSAADLLCTPSGGYANDAELRAGTGSTVLGTASACADITVAPLPEITKSVVSSSVDGGGIWTVVYRIDVKNPDGTFATIYDLEDELTFGAGSSVQSASVTTVPAGVTPESWDGAAATDIALDVPLAAGQTHSYQVTVVVDPGTLDSQTADADCRLDAGETGTGFRNTATVTAGVSTAFDEACEPFTDPSVVKTTIGAPTQNPTTGEWTLAYQLTVTNRSTSAAVPYTLTDTLGLPADVTVVDVYATGPAGATVNGAFTGSTDTGLASATIPAAADAATPATQVFTVTVRFTVPAGLPSGTVCDPAQGPGGLRNEVELAVGSRVSGAVACADVPDVPTPAVGKTVLSQVQQADGTWLVLYRITVANPSGTAASEYTLDDAFALGAGIDLVGTPTIVANPAGVTVEPTWNGDSATTIAEDILLPAAGSHTYTVRAVIDSGTVTGDDAAGDCVLDAGETGTGFGNTASVGTGVATAEAEVCAQAWDPGVTKTLAGVPTRQADGSWLLSYTITVTNPSAVALSYGLVDELHFPAGTTITVQSAAGRAGSPSVESDWDGQTQLQLVADGAALPPNAVHVFDVTVRALLPDDQESEADGWGNSATVESGVGGAVTDEADELADILIPELEVTKTATPSAAVLRIGDTVDYEIEVENVGAGDFTSLYPAVVWDALAGVLDDADLTTGPTATPGAGTFTTDTDGFHWTSALVAGDTVTLSYTATITGGGDADLVNVAFASAPTETPDAPAPADCDAPGCATTDTPLPALEITKTVDQTIVAPGSTVTYTVTVTNTGGVDIPAGDPAVVTDSLADVLDDAVYNGDATADLGTVVFGAGELTWTGGLAAGETATISYTVTVLTNAASGARLVNLAVSDPTLPTLAADGAAADPEATTTSTVQRMANTGLDTVWISLLLALLLLSLGVLLLAVLQRRRQREAT